MRVNFASRVMPDILERFRAAITLREDRTGEPCTVVDALEEAMAAWADREERRGE